LMKEATIEEVKEEVKIYENLPAPKPEEMLKYVYSELTPDLKEQLNELK